MRQRHIRRGAAVLAALFSLTILLYWTALPLRALYRRSPASAVSGPQEAKLLALTFDDGPRRATTTVLLDGLSQRGVQATFFLVGTNLDGNEDLVLRMEEEGHQVGLHSYRHKSLVGLDRAGFYEEVDALRARLEGILGHGGLALRPPYGLADASVRQWAEAPIIQWSIDPEDWSDSDSARQSAHIISRAQDGDIILLHDIYPTSVDTALRVVDALLGEGFYFVTVDELFRARGLSLENGKVYRNAKGG